MGVICSFSGIYQEIQRMPAEAADLFRGFSLLECGDIPGTCGYCAPEAAEEIRKRLAPFRADDIHLLDNGNYHYLTKFWIEKIREPFDLVVFDHHTDMQPSALLPVLSCGSWVKDTLEDPQLAVRRVFLIGPPEEALCTVRDQFAGRLFCISQEEAESMLTAQPDAAAAAETDRLLFWQALQERELPVYLSVDKDILSEEALQVNWDQGSMTLSALEAWIRRIAACRPLCGADLCGEPEKGSDRAWNCNKRLMELLQNMQKVKKT